MIKIVKRIMYYKFIEYKLFNTIKWANGYIGYKKLSNLRPFDHDINDFKKSTNYNS